MIKVLQTSALPLGYGALARKPRRRGKEAFKDLLGAHQFELTEPLRYPLFPALKTILGWAEIDCGPCLAPRRQMLSEAESLRLRDELTQAGLLELILNAQLTSIGG